MKQPTWTSLVLGALRGKPNDFQNVRMLQEQTGGSMNQVTAALHHLRKVRTVDVVIEVDGRGWWFALPPSEDSRSYTNEQRTPEKRPRKRRQYKVKHNQPKGE